VSRPDTSPNARNPGGPIAPVYLSHSIQDADAARRVCDAFREAGVEARWANPTTPETDWNDAEIVRQIANCILFVPIFSERTPTNPDRLVRLEWSIAERRIQADGTRLSVVPVIVAETNENAVRLPACFEGLRTIRVPNNGVSSEFISHFKELLKDEFSQLGTPEHTHGAEFQELPAQSFVDLIELALDATDPERPGTVFGRYKLLERIGEGGFGVVWMAEQQAPIRRNVALKIIKLGMDTREVIARFEAERQALALMEHPNIACVFDAGATDLGRPYFVMELLRGVPITRYCDENCLPADERMRLFITVCRAVHHAHKKGIVHRDIKPSNILVVLLDGIAVPKIIDFGIAKAMGARLTEKTLFTQANSFVGTPIYTSPEQMELNGRNVDLRSDIYSLGVLLYELLSGRLPFDANLLAEKGIDELRRTVRDIDPPTPSQRFQMLAGIDKSSVALSRGSDATRFGTLLRGDLDCVVMRCLAKDPGLRYESAASLVADLERHLANEPVMARAAGRAYRMHRLLRRRRSAMVTGMVALLSLFAFFAVKRAFRSPTVGVASERANPERQRAIDRDTVDALPKADSREAKRVAILPFANLSPDRENAFFADGIHEDLIISLAKIHDLRVISRTSVMAYRNGGNLRSIASDLGVGRIVEGSVRRMGNKVRVTAELVNARTEEPIWADSYDRDMTDEFSLQKELAENIAGALNASMTEGERRLIGRAPTLSVKAYDLYLRGRAQYDTLGQDGTLQQYDGILELFHQAVQEDPQFALAYAQIAQVEAMLYWFSNMDPSPGRILLARGAAESAYRIAPDIPESKIALGVVLYTEARDWEGALSQFRAAEIGLPHDSQLLHLMGNALRRLGRWQEALNCYESSLELNPAAEAAGTSAVQTLYWLRRYSEAEALADQFSRRFPENRIYADFRLLARFEQDGDRATFLERKKVLPSDRNDPDHLIDRYANAFYRRDWRTANLALKDPRLKRIPDTHIVIIDPISFHLAMVAFLDGRKQDADRYSQDAINDYGSYSWTPRQKPWSLMRIAQAEAYGSQGAQAMRDAKIAWDQVADRDATDALTMRPLVGQVLVATGHKEEALTLLQQLMDNPSDWGAQKIRYDPFWSRLSSDPRFDKILKSARSL
jgi:TolB-like protein/Tfp pilus assembly protein PilF